MCFGRLLWARLIKLLTSILTGCRGTTYISPLRTSPNRLNAGPMCFSKRGMLDVSGHTRIAALGMGVISVRRHTDTFLDYTSSSDSMYILRSQMCPVWRY